jgi:hypothetical protein
MSNLFTEGSRIATFEEEFLAYVAMPDGATVGDHVLPNVERAYATGRMPPLLPAIGGTGKVSDETISRLQPCSFGRQDSEDRTDVTIN